MNKAVRLMIALAFPLSIGGCDRSEVTSTESVPEAQSSAEQLSAPVALPEGVMGIRPLAATSDEENAKFEAWCKRYGLDPKDPGMLDADADGDGFSNREEYIAGTNPLESKSMPGMLDGVVMKEFKEVQVPVILREVKGGKARVQRLDTPGTEEWENGAVVKGLPYRVTAVKQEVKADKHGVFSDVSQVTLENQETKETVVLIRDLPARSSETYAIISGPGGVEQKLHADAIIEVPGHKDRKFRVLEIRPEQVVIEEMGTRRPLTIPKR